MCILILFRKQLRVVEFLTEIGADKSAVNQEKKNAVYLAIANKDVEMLRFLRDTHFDVNHEVCCKARSPAMHPAPPSAA